MDPNEQKLKAATDEVLAKMTALVAKRDEELAELKRVSDETAKAMAKRDEEFVALQKEHGEVKAWADKLAAKGNRLGADGSKIKSVGEQFIESAQFKAMIESGELKCAPAEVKALTSASASDAVAHFATERVGMPIYRPERSIRLTDIIPSVRTVNSAIDWIEETGFYHLHATVATQASSGQKNIVVDNAAGFFVGQTIALSVGLAQAEEAVIASVSGSTLTVVDNLTNTHAVGRDVTSSRFIYTAETVLKPNSKITLAKRTASVKTLAHGLPASRQILSDVDALRMHIDMRLMEGLSLSEEEQILRGDGSDTQLQGILTNARTQTYAWSSGPASDTKLDALRRAITLSSKANYPPDAVVVSPDDWEDIELAKGDDGHYIWVAVGEGSARRIWRTNVIETTAMLAGEALVGAFSTGCMLYDREETNIRVAEQHDDHFMRNMVQLLAESRKAFVTMRPEAFVSVDLATAPS